MQSRKSGPIRLQLLAGMLALGLTSAGCTAAPSEGSAPAPAMASPSPSATTSATPSAPSATSTWLPPARSANSPANIKRDRVLAARLDKVLTDEQLAGVRSVLVLVAGRTAYENYPQSDAESHHHVMSVTKSVLSALIGIAIEQGKISGVDATLAELLPKYAPMMTEEQAAVTLEQLLTMTGGFGDQATGGQESEDWVGRIISRGGIKPGQWVYSNDGPHLLSAILTAATGLSALQYARSVLFGPLGIVSEPADEPVAGPGDLALADPGFGWARDPQGVSTGAYGLRLRAWDLAKIGLLYLEGGRWDGQQVVPASWIKQSTRELEKTDFGGGYGYLWWADSPPERERAFAALGSGGQRIVVLPERDIVVVVQVDATQVLGVSESEAERAVDELIFAVLKTYPKPK